MTSQSKALLAKVSDAIDAFRDEHPELKPEEVKAVLSYVDSTTVTVMLLEARAARSKVPVAAPTYHGEF